MVKIKNPMRQLSLSSKLSDSVTTITKCWIPDDANLSVGHFIYLKGDERRWRVDQASLSTIPRAEVPEGARVGQLE